MHLKTIFRRQNLLFVCCSIFIWNMYKVFKNWRTLEDIFSFNFNFLTFIQFCNWIRIINYTLNEQHLKSLTVSF